MRIEDALRELESRQPERMVPDLSRIAALAKLLDEPQLTYPTIHVTGTNGKTTTARLIGRILCTHGLSTGVYTSPHLDSVRERLALCDPPISELEFAETYAHLLPYLREVDESVGRVTYFESLTALAYLWFTEKPVEAGVFEVGMGGLWDATNLIQAKVCVFTEISLDHPELGSTIEEVASEKAGILKQGSVAVIEDTSPAALEAIEPRAAELGGTAVELRHEYDVSAEVAVGGQLLRVRVADTIYEDLFLPLHGWYQANHAATAIAACESFLGKLDPKAVRAALAGATSPGRLEVMDRHPLVVLDGAHNPAGAQALRSSLPETFTWDRLHVVIAVSANKDIAGMAEALAPLHPVAYVASHSSPRAADADRVGEELRRVGIETTAFHSVPDALAAARSNAGDADLILVTGSLYTVADARRALFSDG